MRVDEMKEHIEKLASEMNVKIIKRFHEFGSHTRFKIINIPMLENEINYAAALHELGHQFLRVKYLNVKRNINIQIEEELEAWDWARRNAIEWTYEMERSYRRAIWTYKIEQTAQENPSRYKNISQSLFLNSMKKIMETGEYDELR